jgi:hypothetical protein
MGQMELPIDEVEFDLFVATTRVHVHNGKKNKKPYSGSIGMLHHKCFSSSISIQDRRRGLFF